MKRVMIFFGLKVFEGICLVIVYCIMGAFGKQLNLWFHPNDLSNNVWYSFENFLCGILCILLTILVIGILGIVIAANWEWTKKIEHWKKE